MIITLAWIFCYVSLVVAIVVTQNLFVLKLSGFVDAQNITQFLTQPVSKKSRYELFISALLMITSFSSSISYI